MGERNKDAEIIKCIPTDIHPTSLMKAIPVKTMQSLLSRMGIEYEEGLPQEAYALAWYNEIADNREWVLRMLPKDYILFLLEIWEKREIPMDGSKWEALQYLKLFGLLAYKKGNKALKEEGEIYVISSVKENFYFYLKSKNSRKLMNRYDRWDVVFSGLSYYYGILPMTDLHKMFCQSLKEEISYEEFLPFMKCRSDLWNLGAVLENNKGQTYFMNQNVENPEIMLLYLDEHKDLPYQYISYDKLSYIKSGFGIDNRWPGLSELGNYLVDVMEFSYYRSTVLVHSILIAIQNSTPLEKIKEKLDIISFSNEEQRQMAEKYVIIMYYNIPIYEYKGHTRKEYKKWFDDWERKNKRGSFQLLPGGKETIYGP